MSLPDYYSVLGVLPSAESIVVTAAYRALAQRYHPDKWAEDPTEAHRRMAEINIAFSILNDADLRAEYDAERSANDHADLQSAQRQDVDDAFDDALHGLEERWAVAVEIYPDLLATREGLAKISTSLAFGFVTTLLETKNFGQRIQISRALEQGFLQRYFGTNPEVIAYAKELILEGNRQAARSLNNFVDVLGADTRADLLITRIERQYSIRAGRIKREGLGALAEQVRKYGDFDDAVRLARLLNYKVEENSNGFLGSKLEVTVASPQGFQRRFSSVHTFLQWAQSEFAA